jgi:hypothetical protein
MAPNFGIVGLALAAQLFQVAAVPVDDGPGVSLVAREANFIRYAGWYVQDEDS